MVIPDALKVLRLQPGHKFCLLGQLSHEVGWHHYDTIKELEEKRKLKSATHFGYSQLSRQNIQNIAIDSAQITHEGDREILMPSRLHS